MIDNFLKLTDFEHQNLCSSVKKKAFCPKNRDLLFGDKGRIEKIQFGNDHFPKSNIKTDMENI